MTSQTVPQCESSAAESSSETSPFVLEFYMVQGVGFRCMAYCDRNGKWRSAFNNDELYGDIHVLE
jgi:hypothetical protein